MFELKSMIAAFAMFVPQAQPCMTQPGGFVTFQIADAPRRVQLWLKDQLSCAMPMGPEDCGSAEFLCLRGGCPLAISVGVLITPLVSVHVHTRQWPARSRGGIDSPVSSHAHAAYSWHSHMHVQCVNA